VIRQTLKEWAEKLRRMAQAKRAQGWPDDTVELTLEEIEELAGLIEKPAGEQP
jgi:hypothetical protein